MSTIADISESASELERLIADLSGSGQLVFVFGVGWWTGHLTGVTTPVFRGPADRRWWHVELGDDTASWTMSVRVDEITGVRFVRGPYPFPSFPGREVLTVQFLGPGGETALHCYVHDLYDGQRMRPEKLEAWRALRDATAIATSPGSIGAPSWPRPPEPSRSPGPGSRRQVMGRARGLRLRPPGPAPYSSQRPDREGASDDRGRR